MKYFFRVLLALILAGITVFAVYVYTNGGKLPSKPNQINLTTVSKPPATEKYANKRLLATAKKSKYSLYTTDDRLLLIHGDKEFEFKLWSSYLEKEKPKMYVFDVNSDGTDDVIVRAVSGEEQSTGDFVYDLYILLRETGKEEQYRLVTASQSDWHSILDESVVEELTQLKTCKKFAQFAMTIKNNTIEYDKKTGLAVKNAGYVGFFRSLQDSKGKYMTVDSWSKGKGSYFVSSGGKISCEVEVIIKYKESEAVQKAGTIYFETWVNEKGSLFITSGSMVFRPAKEYLVSDPTAPEAKAWSSVLKNSGAPKGNEVINWIKYSVPIDSKTLTQTLDLSAEQTDICFVDSVSVSEKALVMTAKDGYTFDESAVSKGEYSLTINKGKSGEYEIAYTAALSEDKKTLTIRYDRSYAQQAVQTVDISFGAK